MEAAAATHSGFHENKDGEENVKDQIKYRQKRGANCTTSSTVFNMRVPMRDKINCDFSYAGLKNSFRVAVEVARKEEFGCSGGGIVTNAPAGNMQPTESTLKLPQNITARLCYHFQDIGKSFLD